jgi:hypothetical protein
MLANVLFTRPEFYNAADHFCSALVLGRRRVACCMFSSGCWNAAHQDSGRLCFQILPYLPELCRVLEAFLGFNAAPTAITLVHLISSAADRFICNGVSPFELSRRRALSRASSSTIICCAKMGIHPREAFICAFWAGRGRHNLKKPLF